MFVGVATPQANPTVELEFREYYTGKFCALTTRLTSHAAAPNDRLCDYLRQMPAALESYDKIDLAAFAFACTGSAYLLGHEFEQELTTRLEMERGCPVITATQAIDRELRLRKVRRLALLAPYPEDLCLAAVEYWQGRGYEITRFERIDIGADTRAIYSLTDADVASALAAYAPDDAELLLLSGTGMPSIAALRSARVPLISSNLCLAAEALRRSGHWPGDRLADVDGFRSAKG